MKVINMLSNMLQKRISKLAPPVNTRVDLEEQTKLATELEKRAHDVAKRVHVLEWQIMPENQEKLQ